MRQALIRINLNLGKPKLYNFSYKIALVPLVLHNYCYVTMRLVPCSMREAWLAVIKEDKTKRINIKYMQPSLAAEVNSQKKKKRFPYALADVRILPVFTTLIALTAPSMGLA